MRFLKVLVLTFVAFAVLNGAQAQSASQNKAKYMATLYAVLSTKMKDADIEDDLESLRNNQSFIDKLQKKLGELSNEKSTNAKNREVRKILEKAGKELDSLL